MDGQYLKTACGTPGYVGMHINSVIIINAKIISVMTRSLICRVEVYMPYGIFDLEYESFLKFCHYFT